MLAWETHLQTSDHSARETIVVTLSMCSSDAFSSTCFANAKKQNSFSGACVLFEDAGQSLRFGIPNQLTSLIAWRLSFMLLSESLPMQSADEGAGACTPWTLLCSF